MRDEWDAQLSQWFAQTRETLPQEPFLASLDARMRRADRVRSLGRVVRSVGPALLSGVMPGAWLSGRLRLRHACSLWLAAAAALLFTLTFAGCAHTPRANKASAAAAAEIVRNGRTVVRYCMSASGALYQVNVLRTSGSAQLDRAAMQLVRGTTQGRPAMKNGRPVASCRTTAVSFAPHNATGNAAIQARAP